MESPDVVKILGRTVILALLVAPVCAAQQIPADFDSWIAYVSEQALESLQKPTEVLGAVRAPAAPKAPAQLRYSEECICRVVAEKMNLKLRSDIPLPKVFYASRIPLAQFQDAVESQWGMRPEVVVNCYVAERNEIYINDDSQIYEANKRAMDASLAHEYVHHFQFRYRNSAPDAGDFLEDEAVRIQLWFLDNYIYQPGVCPAEPFCR